MWRRGMLLVCGGCAAATPDTSGEAWTGPVEPVAMGRLDVELGAPGDCVVSVDLEAVERGDCPGCLWSAAFEGHLATERTTCSDGGGAAGRYALGVRVGGTRGTVWLVTGRGGVWRDAAPAVSDDGVVSFRQDVRGEGVLVGVAEAASVTDWRLSGWVMRP